MELKKLIILLFTVAATIYGQQYTLTGKICDSISKEPLSFANLRIERTSRGTSANIEGIYELRLDKGEYKIIVSYIGYRSDTAEVNLSSNFHLNISLEPISINLPDVVIRPGENPANEIIRNAIAAKHKREEKLNSYTFESYTKGLIKTTKDISANNRSISIDLSTQDTAQLKITGILENQARGYYKKPDYYKDEIIARKQSANTPPTINLLTGGRLIQNLYGDDVEFFGKPLPSPLNDDALDYYYFMVEDRVAMDDLNIYQIYFVTREENDPGFSGRIFIADSLFTLMKVDIFLNRAANPGGVLDTVNILQQFIPFDDDIYMPIDYRITAQGDFLGVAKFGFELHSIFYNYEINVPIDDDIFTKAVLTVLPDADNKTDKYWKDIERIPNTEDEISAYRRIDSVSSIPFSFWDNFSLLSPRNKIASNFYVNGLVMMYHFNVVEGHSYDPAFYIEDAFDKRLNSKLQLNYGFADNKFKHDITVEYLLGEYRTSKAAFSLFNKTVDLFSEAIYYNQLTSTLTSLFGKYDFRDYYYTKGFNISFSSEVFPVLQVGLEYFSRTDNTGFNNTDYSFFYKSKTYRTNKPVLDTKINALSATLKFDFRNFIEDGDFRRRIQSYNIIPVITLNGTFSSKNLFGSNRDFNFFKASLSGGAHGFSSTQFNYTIDGVLSDGEIPYQMLYSFPGNIVTGGKNFTFRTLRLGEAVGDKALAVMLEYDFNDEIFRSLDVPLLKDFGMTMAVYFNMAWSSLSDTNISILPQVDYKTLDRPLYEAGFSIGHMLIPVEIEFTWKLNHTGENGFVIGFNTFAL